MATDLERFIKTVKTQGWHESGATCSDWGAVERATGCNAWGTYELSVPGHENEWVWSFSAKDDETARAAVVAHYHNAAVVSHYHNGESLVLYRKRVEFIEIPLPDTDE